MTQLTCGTCLLIGTIGLVLVQQTKAGDLPPIAGWLIAALAGLVFGGLTYRGGLISMLMASVIDAAFGIILILIEYDSLRHLLRILPASDISVIADALDVAGFAMIGAGVICLIALPQGLRYARWFRDAAATRSAMSTARGFPPPAVAVRTSAYVIPSEDRPETRRRLYMVLGGLAIGIGAGVGVLVSSTGDDDAAAGRSPAVAARATPPAAAPIDTTATAAVVAPAASPTDPAPRGESPTGPAAPAAAPSDTVDDLLVAQRAAIATGDAAALAVLLAPDAFGFGVDADEVGEGRDAVVAQLVRDLGDPPPGGFIVTSKSLAIGEERGHAWIAEELELTTPGGEQRRFATTQLAAALDGRWRTLALHWAKPVDDATAERLAILGTLPTPKRITDRDASAGDLGEVVRAAFASRGGFADARSERPDAFNYGSGGERARGTAVKRIFNRLRAQIRMHDGAIVVAGSRWDPAQSTVPWIGYAAVNVDFTSKSRAGTDVTQTFRVLAILLKSGTEWQIVQTHWSNGGPIR